MKVVWYALYYENSSTHSMIIFIRVAVNSHRVVVYKWSGRTRAENRLPAMEFIKWILRKTKLPRTVAT